VGVLPAEAQNVPSGTIELSGGSVAAGIGYTWGNGTLVFDGKKYLVKMDGISIIQVGVSEYTASGTVYNLKKLSDINGVYSAVSAGAAVAGGASATAMRNSNGVIIQMVATWLAQHVGTADRFLLLTALVATLTTTGLALWVFRFTYLRIRQLEDL